MTTLSIDIGGTKFSMAVFEGSQMVARETRATDREGGREWMLAQILRDRPCLEAGSSPGALRHRFWRAGRF